MSFRKWWTKSRIVGITLLLGVVGTILGFAIRDFVSITKISLNQEEKGNSIMALPKFSEDINQKINPTDSWDNLKETINNALDTIIDESWLSQNYSSTNSWVNEISRSTLIYTYWDAQNKKYDKLDKDLDKSLTTNYVTETKKYIKEKITKQFSNILKNASKKGVINEKSTIETILKKNEEIFHIKPNKSSTIYKRLMEVSGKFER